VSGVQGLPEGAAGVYNGDMSYVVYVLLLVISLGAIGLNIFSLPGNWLMAVLALVVSWMSGWTAPYPGWLAVAAVVLVIAEGVEFAGSIVGARKFGASRSATWAAMFGAIAGAIIGVPVPLIGSVIGALLGAFFAAWIVELMQERTLKAASWAALGAALGRGVGLFAKIGCGLVVWVALAVTAWPG
jgi:uncharacterized protein YqgC (DUF456 family)